MMCRTSIFALLAAAMTLVAEGVNITVNANVDSHIGTVKVTAGTQSMTVSRNGTANWTGWVADTAYTPEFTTVDTGYTPRWEVTKSGLSTLSGGAGNNITLPQTYTGCTLRFYGQPNKYTVNFNANGGSISSSPYGTSKEFEYGDVIDFTQISLSAPAGHTFDGWWTASSGGYRFGNTVEVTSSSTVYAHWKKIKYTVNFSANGGSISSSPYGTSKEFEYGDVIDFTQISLSAPAGHTFDGWWTASSGGYRFGNTVEVTSSSTVYAHWKIIQYQVTFSANGGTITANQYANPQTFNYNDTLYFDRISVSRPGYTFDGWSAYASGSTHRFGATVPVTSSSTVYARWTPQYSVAFDANGGTITANQYNNPQTFSYNDTLYFNRISVSRPGYTFDGWSAYASGSTHRFGATVPVTSSSTVYARWTKNPIVTFVLNGGTFQNGWMTPTNYVEGVGMNLPTAADITYTNRAFIGWYEDEMCLGDRVTKIDSSDRGDRTFYARWEGKTYKVSFDANGGTGRGEQDLSMVNSDQLKTIAELRITAPQGYTFNAWNTAQDVSGDSYVDGAVIYNNLTNVANATVTLYAQWTPNPYEVAFQPNGADGGEMPNQSFTYDVPQQLDAAGFTYTGRAFEKWSSDTNYNYRTTYYADGATVTNLATGGVVNLYANWTGIVYTVSFDANGGEGEMGPITCTYAVPTNLPACTFTRDGWGFSGWTTNGADGVVFADRARVTNLTTTAEVTLLACWTGVTYAVVLDARDPKGENNGVFTNGEGEAVSVWTNRYTVGDVWVVPTSVTNVNSHFPFAGWTYEDTNGVTITVTESDVVPPPSVFGGATNLVAAWNLEDDDFAIAVDAAGLGLQFNTFGTAGLEFPYEENSYSADWVVQTEVVSNSPSAVQSGRLPEWGSGTVFASWLTVKVTGAGVLSFWWKCSAKDRITRSNKLFGDAFYFGKYGTDHSFEALTVLEGETDWCQVVYTNKDESVTLAWEFEFNPYNNRSLGGGTGWVDRVTWTPDGGMPVDVTLTHAVPYDWLSTNFPDDYASASGDASALDAFAEGDSPNGKPMKVWQEYWAGTDPNDANDLFRANIAISNNMAHITWLPDLSVTGDPKRVYHVLCAPTLSTEWTVLQSNVVERLEVELPALDGSGVSTNRFFKVELDWEGRK